MADAITAGAADPQATGLQEKVTALEKRFTELERVPPSAYQSKPWHERSLVVTLIGIIITAAFGAVGAGYASLNSRLGVLTSLQNEVSNLGAAVNSKADSALHTTQLNNHGAEIATLRTSVNTLFSNANASLVNGTLLQQHETRLEAAFGEMVTLGKAVAKLEAECTTNNGELKQMKDVRCEKMQTELAGLRERLAAIEALLKRSTTSAPSSPLVGRDG